MKILEFGANFRSTHSVQYFSTVNLLEYDLIIIDYNHILKESNALTRDVYLKRKDELEEYVRLKNVPIVYFTPQPRLIKLKAGYDLKNMDLLFLDLLL